MTVLSFSFPGPLLLSLVTLVWYKLGYSYSKVAQISYRNINNELISWWSIEFGVSNCKCTERSSFHRLSCCAISKKSLHCFEQQFDQLKILKLYWTKQEQWDSRYWYLGNFCREGVDSCLITHILQWRWCTLVSCWHCNKKKKVFTWMTSTKMQSEPLVWTKLLFISPQNFPLYMQARKKVHCLNRSNHHQLCIHRSIEHCFFRWMKKNIFE